MTVIGAFTIITVMLILLWGAADLAMVAVMGLAGIQNPGRHFAGAPGPAVQQQDLKRRST